jgi:hypothetical protein
MGVEWHPVENSKLASAGAIASTHHFHSHFYSSSQAGMASSSFGIEGHRQVTQPCSCFRSSSSKVGPLDFEQTLLSVERRSCTVAFF